MPRSKPRNKRYTPRKGEPSSLESSLPVSAKMVAHFQEGMNNCLLRLHFSGLNGRDLASLVFSFGHAWVLAAQMDNCEEIRGEIESAVTELGKAVIADSVELHSEQYDRMLDLVRLTTDVVARSTKGEFVKAGVELRKDGTVECVDDFLVSLAKAKLLEIVNDSETNSAQKSAI